MPPIVAQASLAELAKGIDAAFAPISQAVNDVIFFEITAFGVSVPLVLIWLITGAIVITISLRFVNLRGFGHALSLVFRPRKAHKGAGEITHFEALSSALSGTVGLGNIASVPVAIVLGGPGAMFWMVCAGFFGMSSKFAECSLAVKYRRENPDGTIIGGPMFYIENIFRRLGLGGVGKGLAIFFAVMAIGASVSIFQVNQAYAQFSSVTGVEAPMLYGIIMAGLVGVVIVGGIRSIARVTSKMVPFMGLLYLGAATVILLLNIDKIPHAIVLVFESAFGVHAAAGGMVGALINGVKRATYSSEAGVGSAAIAHAAVKTDNPLTEGYVALLEPFIDTIVVCSATALVIIVTGAYEPFVGAGADYKGIEITSAAFAGAFSWFPWILLVSVTLFAFSTLVSWAYYGSQAAAYLFGDSRAVDLGYKLILCLLLSAGAAVSLSSIVNFIDSMLFAMAIPNILALYLLLPELRRDLRAYEGQFLKPKP